MTFISYYIVAFLLYSDSTQAERKTIKIKQKKKKIYTIYIHIPQVLLIMPSFRCMSLAIA